MVVHVEGVVVVVVVMVPVAWLRRGGVAGGIGSTGVGGWTC